MNLYKQRPMRGIHLLLAVGLVLSALPASFGAEGEAQEVERFPTVLRRAVTLWSDGTRLAGDLHYPKDQAEGEKLPAIVLCHGWGGVKSHLNRQIAPRFAAAGFVVLSFDYRGWGESNSRLIINGAMPKPDENGNVTVTAQAVTQLVDPLDQQEDIDAAITFIEGEPGVDATRIGIWGSSFGGGHVIWRAAHDKRVKAVAAQVGGMDMRSGLEASYKAQGLDLSALHAQAIKRVRGEMAPVPQNEVKIEGLTGQPYNERFVDFVPKAHTDKITAPVLIIDAKKEHYFDIKENGGEVYEKLKGRVPTEYHLIEGGHYDIYSGKDLDFAMKLEIAWFQEHLKGTK